MSEIDNPRGLLSSLLIKGQWLYQLNKHISINSFDVDCNKSFYSEQYINAIKSQDIDCLIGDNDKYESW